MSAYDALGWIGVGMFAAVACLLWLGVVAVFIVIYDKLKGN